TIVEYMDRLVPVEDEEISAELEKAFRKRGVELLLGHKVTSASVEDGHVAVSIVPREGTPDAGPLLRTTDKLLVAVGITGNVENIGLEQVGIGVKQSFIEVDAEYATSVKGVYA